MGRTDFSGEANSSSAMVTVTVGGEKMNVYLKDTFDVSDSSTKTRGSRLSTLRSLCPIPEGRHVGRSCRRQSNGCGTRHEFKNLDKSVTNFRGGVNKGWTRMMAESVAD